MGPVATTIVEQMCGGRTSRLMVMIGAFNFLDHEYGVSFKFRGSKRSNHVEVTLNASDTYTMTFRKLTNGGLKATTVVKASFLFWDQLKPVFENETGLRLSL